MVPAASCWQCCTSRLNTARNVAKSGASSEPSSCSRSSRNMSSVRSGYSADWEGGGGVAGMPCPLQQAGQGGDNLCRDDRQHRDRGGTSPSHRLLADRLSQHGCCQVHDNHLASKDRHDYGQEMTPGGLPASLPGRLTESTVWSKDRIWPWLGAGLIDGRACGAVPLDGGGVHLHSLYWHIADLVLGLERLVLHHLDGNVNCLQFERSRKIDGKWENMQKCSGLFWDG